MLCIHLIKAIQDGNNDPNLPVQMEIERRRPGYWREHYMQVAALALLVAVLIFYSLKGWEIILPL